MTDSKIFKKTLKREKVILTLVVDPTQQTQPRVQSLSPTRVDERLVRNKAAETGHLFELPP